MGKTEKTEKTKGAPHHTRRYLIVGISLTLFNFGFYSIIVNIINNNDFLWVSSFISTVVTTILAYILHSKITWKERKVTKTSIYKFFIWNAILAFAVGPWITQLFSYLTPIYDFAYNIYQNLHLDFIKYEFIQSTGAFIFSGIVTMILNFLFYDNFVFGKKNQKPKEEEK